MLTFWLKFALAKKPLRVRMITQSREIRCYCHHAMPAFVIILTSADQTRGQSNLTKSASRGAHSPVRGHPGGRKLYH